MSRLPRSPRVLAVSAVLLIGATLGAPQVYSQVGPARAEASDILSALGLGCTGGAEPFLRTELFFGSNKPDGSVVTEAQFQAFLNDVITPRFPDGLTLLTGLGQFRGSSGVIQRERSMVLILLYPRQTARESSANIEQIRAKYEQQFEQESVLRADERLPECVSF
jgi:hypothetical protein